jgi:glycosyltransferase involved in cell wall biosynthesis
MRALVIAPQPFFTPRGTPFSVYYRTLVTASLGVEVDLLTYGEGQDVDIPGVRVVRLPRSLWRKPIRTGPSAAKLYLDAFLLVWTVALLIRHRYPVVHAHEEAVFFCRLLKPIFRFRLIYDMHSSLPQQLTNFNFTRSKALIGIFARLEDSAIRSADMIITVCPALADYVRGRGVPDDRHLLIENSLFDPVRVAGLQSNAATATGAAQVGGDPRERFGLPPAARMVVYAGTLEHYQGIELLLQAFARAAAEREDLYLLVCGGSAPQVEHYRRQSATLGVGDRCRWLGRVPQAVAHWLNAAADVLVSPRREGMNTPLKIYELLARGKPLVATRIHSHTQVLNDDVAFLVEPEPVDMARGLLEALEPGGRRAQVVANARELYEKRYSRAAYEKKMRTLLRSVGACAA